MLYGALVKEVEIRYTANGKGFMSNTIAVRRKFKNEKGDYESDFINIKVFGKSAEYIEKYAKKGDKVLIRGHIQTGKYENKKGEVVYTTDVFVDEINIVNSNKKTEKKDTKDDTIYIDDITLDDENFLD